MNNSSNITPEPTEAFPYTPPSDEIKVKYEAKYQLISNAMLDVVPLNTPIYSHVKSLLLSVFPLFPMCIKIMLNHQSLILPEEYSQHNHESLHNQKEKESLPPNPLG